jgi:CTP synthase (UTP-ammonia lyase)
MQEQDVKITKENLRIIIAKLLAKALTAVIKIVRVKILPRVTERYCKSLQKGAEKLANKTQELIDKIPNITDTKKKIGLLYVLKLVRESVYSVGTALTTLATQIDHEVDFSPIEEKVMEPEVVETLAMLETTAAGDNLGGCGPDGCEIA